MINMIKQHNSDQQPGCNCSDKEWQIQFEKLRASTECSYRKHLHYRDEMYINWHSSYQSYGFSGKTQWETYCDFINGILDTIRSGESDYCFYIYHITEILRFEKNRLQTRWLPNEQCFRVWLSEAN